MEAAHVTRGQLHRCNGFIVNRPTRPGGERRDLDKLGRRAVDPRGDSSKRVPAARTDFVEDISDCCLQDRIRALFRAAEHVRSLSLRQLVPVDNIHIIIFSMGMTRIAEAPAAFNFCSVSQNTDS